MKTCKGFTLIELMIIVVVIAIVMSVGLPQVSVFLKSTSLVANTNDLVAGLHAARGSAIKVGSRVTICKSTNAGSAAPTCTNDAANKGWEDGWFVFEEGTNIGNVVGEYTAADGPVLRRNTGAEGDAKIGSLAPAIFDFVSFSSRGLPTAANGSSVSGVFLLCDKRIVTGVEKWIVSNTVKLIASGRAGASKEGTLQADGVTGVVCPL